MSLTLPLFSTLLCSYSVIFNCFGTGRYSEHWTGRGETPSGFEVKAACEMQKQNCSCFVFPLNMQKSLVRLSRFG